MLFRKLGEGIRTSHTLQTLLEGFDVDNLCIASRLCRCLSCYSYFAMDRFGSHVAYDVSCFIRMDTALYFEYYIHGS